jgi:glucose-6-phosphate isomerase
VRPWVLSLAPQNKQTNKQTKPSNNKLLAWEQWLTDTQKAVFCQSQQKFVRLPSQQINWVLWHMPLSPSYMEGDVYG